MNLREKKKRDTRKKILREAKKLFLAKGYTDTSIEFIAEAAQVSVGTIYNYFSSKAGVMIAINAADTDMMLAELGGDEIASASVEELLWNVTERTLGFMQQYPRHLMRELMAATFSNLNSDLAAGLSRQDERFLTHIAGLLHRLKDEGRLKEETDPEAVAFALYSLVFGAIILYLAEEERTIEDTSNLIASMIGQFCRGILPERS